MSMPSTLPTDIQAALQHAVGEANNAYAPVTGKKRKRRTKDAETRDKNEGESETEGGGNEPKGKGRRKKKKSKKSASIAPEEDDERLNVEELTTADPPRKKKKSKKKDKGKQSEDHSFSLQAVYAQQNAFDLQAAASSNNPASTAAFLSALVTAASETRTQQSPPPHPDNPTNQQFDHGQQHQHGPQYMPYPPPPMGYQYHPSPQYGHPPPHPSAQQPPSLFATPIGVPLNDLAFGSNEDILRALQDLDMGKIANVLKTLGEAAAAANVPHQQQHQSGFLGGSGLPVAGVPATLNQVPTTAGDILHTNAVETKQQQQNEQQPQQPQQQQQVTQGRTGHNRVLDMSLPGPELHMNADHAYLLANKWMNAAKLAEMVKNQGLVYKKGKFSAIEEKQLKDAIEQYRVRMQMAPEQISDLIFAKNDKGAKDNDFWSEITSAVPQRPIIAVYHHVRRSYHPMKQQGKWMDAEDASLVEAVADLGQAWEKVSLRVGRMSSDCRDRYRNHIINRDIRVTGQWKKEEEEELTRIVTEMTVSRGKDFDNDVFWGKVSERMGNKRGRQQCRIKWTDSLAKTIKNEGQKPRWSQQDAYILVHKVDSMNVRDDTEIDWKTLPDAGWNFWSAHSLQRRWLTLKRSIKGFEEMTHQEIMDILRVKKAQLPVPPITSSKKKKFTSAATIMDDSADDPLEAGSSTGPGTVAGTIS